MEVVLGIDTSCYTTSLALVSLEGQLVAEARQLLQVELGQRGLQQSAAVFQHVQNLPRLFEQLEPHLKQVCLKAVIASARPRPQEESYMPVFKVGEAFGRSIAAVQGVPFFETSHQEGHLAAGIASAGGPTEAAFLGVHLSGGTTEVVAVRRQAKGYAIQLLGGSMDLHAGQLVDRVGVKLGLSFPAGPKLEQLAQGAVGTVTLKSVVKGLSCSFAGAETQAGRYIEQQLPPAEIARAVEQCIANTLEKLIKAAQAKGQPDNSQSVLIVGGVSANNYIRQRLKHRLEHKAVGVKLFFATPVLSSDNAVGVAHLGREMVVEHEE